MAVKSQTVLREILRIIDHRDGMDQRASDLVHCSHLLVNDLEDCLNPDRGKSLDESAVQLIFQQSGIDATHWLVGKLCDQIRDIRALVSQLRDLVAEHEEATDV